MLNVNPNRYVLVDFDEERKLYFPIARAIELEKAMGDKSLMSILSDEEKMTSFTFIVTAYWIGLKTEDKKLTPQKVENFIASKLENAADMEEYVGILHGLVDGLIAAFQATGILAKPKKETEIEQEKEELNEGKTQTSPAG